MNRPRSIRAARLAAIGRVAFLGLVVGACSSSAPAPSSTPIGSTPPSPSASPSAAPSAGPVTTPEAAAALVIGSDPRFAGVTPKDPDLIGQCCFSTAIPAGDGFAVTIEIGWGDCPAGCINRHHWFYTVATDGTIHLDREDGPELPADVGGSGGGGIVGIRGIATAGPVCPVVRPGDPACADRPVVGATIHVIDSTGVEVATLETDAAGAFVVTLPPGRYRVVPDRVDGLMGTAAPVDVTVDSALAIVQLSYDTGIR